MSDDRIKDTARQLRLSVELVAVLLHSLGIQKRGKTWHSGGWRNHYSTFPDADNFAHCKQLEASGWVHGYGAHSYDGPVMTFRVTGAGIAALRLCGWTIVEVRP